METIGFTGLGVMGKSMARNLKKAGYPVIGYARHPWKVQDLIDEGILMADSIQELCSKSDIVITMVGFPADVEEVYFSENGILNSLRPGSTAIDMTTSDPDLAVKLFQEGEKKGLRILDAPVTGGDLGARNGTLTILCGGSKEDFEKIKPVFEAMGTNIQYMGEAGSGQSAKLVNQILIAGAMAGVAEAWAYCQKKDMDPLQIYNALHLGAAASKSLDLYWPRLINKDMEPGFYIKHFIKDMNLANMQAIQEHLDLPVLQQVLKEYKQLDGSKGTQALAEFYK